MTTQEAAEFCVLFSDKHNLLAGFGDLCSLGQVRSVLRDLGSSTASLQQSARGANRAGEEEKA